MVENERSIFRNTAFSTAGRGAGDLFAFLFLIVFARSFGDVALGEFSFAMAIGAMFAMFVALGMNSLLVREIARAPSEGPRLVGAIAGLQLLVAATMFVALLLLSGLLVDGARGRQILLIMGLYQLIHTLALAFASYFRAREQTQFSAGIEAGHKALILGLGCLAILLIGQPQIALLVYPVAAAAMYVAGFVLLARHHAPPRLHLDFALSRRWFISSLPLFAFNAISVLKQRAGFIVLGVTGEAAAVGLYAAGDRLIAAASLLLVMFNGAVFPVMSRLASSPAELERLFARCLRLSLTLVLPAATAIVLLREPIIGLVFGSGFAPAADALGLLAAAMVPAAISGLSTMLLIARDRLGALLRIQLAGLVVFFAAMAAFVSGGSFIGLAWSVLITKLVICAASLAYLHRQGYTLALWSILRGPSAAAAGMVIVFMLSGALPSALQLTLAAAAGVALLVAFKGIASHDVAYLRRIFGRAR